MWNIAQHPIGRNGRSPDKAPSASNPCKHKIDTREVFMSILTKKHDMKDTSRVSPANLHSVCAVVLRTGASTTRDSRSRGPDYASGFSFISSLPFGWVREWYFAVLPRQFDSPASLREISALSDLTTPWNPPASSHLCSREPTKTHTWNQHGRKGHRSGGGAADSSRCRVIQRENEIRWPADRFAAEKREGKIQSGIQGHRQIVELIAAIAVSEKTRTIRVVQYGIR